MDQANENLVNGELSINNWRNNTLIEEYTRNAMIDITNRQVY